MKTRRVVALSVGVAVALGGGVLAVMSDDPTFMGAGAVLIILGLVGLMPLFEAALD